MKVRLNKDIFNSTSQSDFDKLVNDITYKNRYDLYLDSDDFRGTELFSNTTTSNKEIMNEAFVNSINAVFDKDIDCDVRKSAPTATDKVFTVGECITYLNQPLCIIVENEENDKCFVNAILSEFLPRSLKIDVGQYEQDNWLKYDGAGGKVNVASKIKNRYNSSGCKSKMLKIFVIFDSDKRCPDDTPKNTVLESELKKYSIPYHELEKRSIENYMPDSIISGQYIYTNHNADWINAYLNLTEQQKDYISIAEGYSKDIHSNQSPDVQASFNGGFINQNQLTLIQNISVSNLNTLNGGLELKSGPFKNEFPKFFMYADKSQLISRTANQSNKNELSDIAKSIRDLL